MSSTTFRGGRYGSPFWAFVAGAGWTGLGLVLAIQIGTPVSTMVAVVLAVAAGIVAILTDSFVHRRGIQLDYGAADQRGNELARVLVPSASGGPFAWAVSRLHRAAISRQARRQLSVFEFVVRELDNVLSYGPFAIPYLPVFAVSVVAGLSRTFAPQQVRS